MSESYVGEIKLLPYGYSPENWFRCEGQLLKIVDFTPLYAVIGDIYGGDGHIHFALPNLKQRAPRGTGSGPGLTNCRLGEHSGWPAIPLTYDQVPNHTHDIKAKKGSDNVAGTSMLLGRNGPGTDTYANPPDLNAQTKMSEDVLRIAGTSYPHENRQPSLGVYYCICYNGVFPPRN